MRRIGMIFKGSYSKRDVVRRFIKLAKSNKQYSVEELMSLKIGDYITLNNYPYEGVDATVLSIDYNAKW